MGSYAYGVNADLSDTDVYGWCIPPKEYVFPHQCGGEIEGFGDQKKRFQNFQKHHIIDPSTKRSYDIDIYNVVRYFDLCANNNPNMLDSLFVPQRCILHMAPVAALVRENRRLFLHKGAMHKLKGYAFAQLSKMDVKKQNAPEVHALWAFEDKYGIPHTTTFEEVDRLEATFFPRDGGEGFVEYNDKHLGGINALSALKAREYLELYKALFAKNKRLDGIKRYGFDVKFAYHVIRLASQATQILMEGDLDLEEPGRREHMKAVRRGEVSEADIRAWFSSAEKNLETLYANSKLREKPDWDKIKALLLDVLRSHYGDLSTVYREPGLDKRTLEEIGTMIDRWRSINNG